MNSEDRQSAGSKSYRVVTAAFGALFILLAVAIIVVSEWTAGVMLAAVVVGGLGIDAVVSAWRDRKSLIGRIGPLP